MFADMPCWCATMAHGLVTRRCETLTAAMLQRSGPRDRQVILTIGDDTLGLCRQPVEKRLILLLQDLLLRLLFFLDLLYTWMSDCSFDGGTTHPRHQT